MYMYTIPPVAVPTAHITINKDRQKVHDSHKIYLKDGDHFEFELFNPTTQVLLAKISIDGKLIDNAGMILNPGQRYFLDRYFNKPNKFKFYTYEVEGNNAEVANAISQNGLVKVEFFEEYIAPTITTSTTTTPHTITWIAPEFTYTNGVNVGLNRSSNNIDPAKVSFNGTADVFSNYYNVSGSVLRSFAKSIPTNNEVTLDSLFSKVAETGRVEAGDKSDQTFKTVNKSFSSRPMHTVSYKLLPVSFVESKSLKTYCPECGKSIKSKWKFCTSCGTKLK